jgi:hypothetical protein
VVEAFDALGSAGLDPGRASRPWAVWTAEAITRRDRDLLASFPAHATFEVDGLGPVRFCHASPRDDNEMLTTLTPEQRWRSALDGVDTSVIVCGHTHTQFDRRVGRWRVINAGSVGMPYEGRAGAYWLQLGPGIELRRTTAASTPTSSTAPMRTRRSSISVGASTCPGLPFVAGGPPHGPRPPYRSRS